MDVCLAIASRREVRDYAPEPLPGRRRRRGSSTPAGSPAAPRTGSRGHSSFPSRGQRVERLAAAVFAPTNVLGAALVVAVVVSGKGPVSFDAGRAAQNMLLEAWNEGVGGSPNGVADQDGAGAALDVSTRMRRSPSCSASAIRHGLATHRRARPRNGALVPTGGRSTTSCGGCRDRGDERRSIRNARSRLGHGSGCVRSHLLPARDLALHDGEPRRRELALPVTGVALAVTEHERCRDDVALDPQVHDLTRARKPRVPDGRALGRPEPDDERSLDRDRVWGRRALRQPCRRLR